MTINHTDVVFKLNFIGLQIELSRQATGAVRPKTNQNASNTTKTPKKISIARTAPETGYAASS